MKSYLRKLCLEERVKNDLDSCKPTNNTQESSTDMTVAFLIDDDLT